MSSSSGSWSRSRRRSRINIIILFLLSLLILILLLLVCFTHHSLFAMILCTSSRRRRRRRQATLATFYCDLPWFKESPQVSQPQQLPLSRSQFRVLTAKGALRSPPPGLAKVAAAAPAARTPAVSQELCTSDSGHTLL